MIGLQHRLVSRGLALAILLLVTAAGFGIVLSLLGSGQDDDDLERSQHLLAGYQRVAARLPALEQRLAVRQKEAASLPGLWPGATSPLATAGLQGEVKRLVEAGGGQVRSAQEIPAAPEGGFERIGLRVDLTVPMTALPALLQGLDAHTPYLFVDKLDLHAPDPPGKGAPMLVIHGEISGYRAGKPV